MSDSVTCTGADDCPADPHIHGCFADRGNCDSPAEHRGDSVLDDFEAEDVVECTECGETYSGYGHVCWSPPDALSLARALVDVYERCGLDGISDEMTNWQLDVSNDHYLTYQDARRLVQTADNGGQTNA